MADQTPFNPLSFFNALHREYERVLTARHGQSEEIDDALSIAFERCEDTTNKLCEDQPELACHKGCATCCTLRVLATAPEIFLIAKTIKADPELAKVLPERIFASDKLTRNLDEPGRVKLRNRCPFILSAGSCSIYPVRPLACRGHASYSVKDCVDAAGGRAVEIAYSEPHQLVRSLVQNALQSALREHNLAWGIYELNHGLSIALTDEHALDEWLKGNDPLAPAQVNDISAEEMAETFDALKATRS
jgi:Fe-S-cluster containining protein